MTHITDYKQRQVHRDAYILWLETLERKPRDRSEPLVRGTRPSARTIRKKILEGI